MPERMLEHIGRKYSGREDLQIRSEGFGEGTCTRIQSHSQSLAHLNRTRQLSCVLLANSIAATQGAGKISK